MSTNTSENRSRFNWTKQRETAAVLLAEDELTDTEIAAKVGISARQLWAWKKIPEFRARMDELVRDMGDVAMRYAITRRTRRIKGYDERRDKILKVIAERAEEHAEIHGGDTGLLVKSTKSVGSGPAAEIIDEYAVDVAVLKELRELEKQAAIEAGQWTEKREHSAPDIESLLAAEMARLAGGAAASVPGDTQRSNEGDS